MIQYPSYIINEHFITYLYEHLPFKDIIPIKRISNNIHLAYDDLNDYRNNSCLERVIAHVNIFSYPGTIEQINLFLTDEIHDSIFKKFLDLIKGNLDNTQIYVLDKKIFSMKNIYENIRHTFEKNLNKKYSFDFNDVLGDIHKYDKEQSHFVMMSPRFLSVLILYEKLEEKDVYFLNTKRVYKTIRSRNKKIKYFVNPYQRSNELFVFSVNNSDPEMQFLYDIPQNFRVSTADTPTSITIGLEMMFKFVGNIHTRRLVIT